jgi:diguanylate cyclase (GGDEF)-like protein
VTAGIEEIAQLRRALERAEAKATEACRKLDASEERFQIVEAELRRYQAQLEAANARLQELATTDPLTGLSNRRVFDDRLTAEFAQARRHGRALSVMLLDVDNFKQRNDLYGHDEGDATLRQFAGLLERSVRESDLVVRYGGEEFVLLLPETDETQALLLAGRILTAVREKTWQHAQMTVSGRVAGLQPTTINQYQLVSLADAALYTAKRAGKDREVSYAAHYQQG